MRSSGQRRGKWTVCPIRSTSASVIEFSPWRQIPALLAVKSFREKKANGYGLVITGCFILSMAKRNTSSFMVLPAGEKHTGEYLWRRSSL